MKECPWMEALLIEPIAHVKREKNFYRGKYRKTKERNEAKPIPTRHIRSSNINI